MHSEKGFSTLLMVGIMAMVLMVFGATLFATKPTPPLNSHASEGTIHQVSLPASARIHALASVTLKPSEVGVSTSITAESGDDLNNASNDLDNENLDESKSDENDINTQSASL